MHGRGKGTRLLDVERINVLDVIASLLLENFLERMEEEISGKGGLNSSLSKGSIECLSFTKFLCRI